MEKIKSATLVKETGAILREKGTVVNEKTRRAVLSAAVEGITRLLESVDGEAQVNLGGKYTFVKYLVPARKRRNPKTGEEFMDVDKYAIKIKAGAGIKDHFKTIEVTPEALASLNAETADAE